MNEFPFRFFKILFAFVQPSFSGFFKCKPHQKFEIKNKITHFTADSFISLIRYKKVIQKKTSQLRQANRTNVSIPLTSYWKQLSHDDFNFVTNSWLVSMATYSAKHRTFTFGLYVKHWEFLIWKKLNQWFRSFGFLWLI